MMNKSKRITGKLTITFAGIVAMFALTTIMNSCDNKKQVKETDETTESEVELNNGTKWKANPETTAGINNMIKVLSDFQEGENAADYQSLQKTLDTEFNLILEKCTMEGEAHNQLHNYLMPLKGLISKLSSADSGELSTTIADIDDHLQLYGEFFE